MKAFLILLVLAAALGRPALAVEPDEILADAQLEARARDISRGLRCVVCQNQSIDDSNAEIARDMRLIVRERLMAGDTDAQVVDFIVARYGDFVLLDPPFRLSTTPLWLGPPIVVAAAALVLFVVVRRRQHARAEEGEIGPLSPDDRARLDALIASLDEPTPGGPTLGGPTLSDSDRALPDS